VTAERHAILSTNTSGLNITKLAKSTDDPARVIGTHWFNPPMLMDLVEVIMTEHTPDSVASTAGAVVEDFGKMSIHYKMDVPSFIVNRLIRSYGEDPAWVVYCGEHTMLGVDSAMKSDEGF